MLPEAEVDDSAAVLAGLDGRKMSKSYNNTIPLFAPEKQFRKLIMRIKTNSQEPGEPKEADGNTLFEIYRAFATPAQVEDVRRQYSDGIAWGEMKNYLFEHLNLMLKDPREKYEALMAQPEEIGKVLEQGAEKAREQSSAFLKELYKAVGISAFANGRLTTSVCRVTMRSDFSAMETDSRTRARQGSKTDNGKASYRNDTTEPRRRHSDVNPSATRVAMERAAKSAARDNQKVISSAEQLDFELPAAKGAGCAASSANSSTTRDG